MPLNVYDGESYRKYQAGAVREAFLKTGEDAPGDVLPKMQKRLCHAALMRLPFYADATGVQEHGIAERMWGAHG